RRADRRPAPHIRHLGIVCDPRDQPDHGRSGSRLVPGGNSMGGRNAGGDLHQRKAFRAVSNRCRGAGGGRAHRRRRCTRQPARRGRQFALPPPFGAGRSHRPMTLADYPAETFVRTAPVAATLVGITAGLIGPVVIMRDLAFAVHGSAELTFTGAAAGLVAANDPVLGALLGSIVVATAIGLLGNRVRERNSAIGVILAFG